MGQWPAWLWEMVLGIQETVSSKASVVLRGSTVGVGITICEGWREERISRTQPQPWKPSSQQLLLAQTLSLLSQERDWHFVVLDQGLRHHLPWEKYQPAAHCWSWGRVCTTTQQHSGQLSTALLLPLTALCQLCHIIVLGSHHQNSTMHLSYIKVRLMEKRLLTFPPSRLLGYARNAKTIDGKCMAR